MTEISRRECVVVVNAASGKSHHVDGDPERGNLLRTMLEERWTVAQVVPALSGKDVQSLYFILREPLKSAST